MGEHVTSATDSPRLLVIDDEQSICFAFRRYFERRGADVSVAATGRDGVARWKQGRQDVVFLDVRLPDANGLDVLDELVRADPPARVIVMTAYGTLETVTRAIRGKAFDYMVKPVDLDRAGELVSQAMAASAGAARPPEPAAPQTMIVGASATMQEVYKQIGRVADTGTVVLIRGRTGTGKELVARAIHEHSARRGKPFVPVNCGALPENLVESELFGYVRGAFTGADADKPGRFEAADGGTLFLDEVGELPLNAQVKLLRFLDSQTIERLGSIRPISLDVRIVAATNRDLAAAIAAGHFRSDLFYRLAVMQIDLPPLSQRKEDILPLARHFLAQRAGQGPPPAISTEASELLLAYPWPGNVRELRNAVEHAAIVANGPILAVHLPESVRSGCSGGDTLEQALAAYADAVQATGQPWHPAAVAALERELIQRALARTRGHRRAAADLLGLHRNTLRTKIRELLPDLDEPETD